MTRRADRGTRAHASKLSRLVLLTRVLVYATKRPTRFRPRGPICPLSVSLRRSAQASSEFQSRVPGKERDRQCNGPPLGERA